MATMQLQDILFSQGFGTRRVCAGLVQQELVKVAGQVCAEPAEPFEAEALQFTVQGVDWQYFEKAYLMLHKPAGYECSQKPSTYPSIYRFCRVSDKKTSVGPSARLRVTLDVFVLPMHKIGRRTTSYRCRRNGVVPCESCA